MRWTQTAITSCLLPFASALSLANFQQISPSAVSIACLITYDSQIASCTKADFADGAACSDACIAGLQTINQEVDEACQGIQVSSATLLGMIFQNKMITALCPNSGTSTTEFTSSQTATVSSSQATTSSTSTKSTTPESEPSTTSSTATSKTVAKTTSTISTTNIVKKTTTATATSSSSLTTSKSTSTSLASTLALDTATTLSTASSSSTTSTTTTSAVHQQSHTSAQQKQLEAIKDTGGGSPFDIVDSSGRVQIRRGDQQSIFAAVAAVTIAIMLGF